MWSMLWKWFRRDEAHPSVTDTSKRSLEARSADDELTTAADLVEGNTRQSLTCRPGMFLNPEQAPPVAENQPQIAKPKREVSPPKRDESRSNSTRTLTADDGNWPIFSGMSNSFKDLDDADESDDSDEQSPFKTIMPDD